MKAINLAIFREYDIRGKYPQDIDKNTAYRLGRAFVLALNAKVIAVGRDRRVESAKLMPSFISGARSCGCLVYQLGVCSTPELSLAVGIKKMAGGAIMTASHNPQGWAGVKLYNSSGVPLGLKTGLQDVIKLLDYKDVKTNHKIKKSTIKKLKVVTDYYRLVTSKTNRRKIKPFNLVLDASGGSGDGLVGYVFSCLTAKIIKINFRAGDKYIDHGLNPLLAGNQREVKKAIKKNRADLGVIWDGDADRVVFVDGLGQFVHPYYINCLLSKIILAKKPGLKLLIDARMPAGPSEIIKQYGGRPIVNRSGTANIIQAMIKREILFGCENSGHYFFNFKFYGAKKNNYIYSDSVLPVLLIMEYLADKKLSLAEAIADFRRQYLISGEINFKVNNFSKLKSAIKKEYRGYKSATVDGVSVYGPSLAVGNAGWFFNLRPSHTEPLARLNIEAKNQIVLKKLKQQLLKIIKKNYV